MLYFCTLFNSNYAAKGLAMYWSLKKVCPAFRLFVFAFDDIIADALNRMQFPEVTVVTLNELEDEELLQVKPTRSVGEYCWTCTSSTILYCLSHYDIDHCTYLDADLYFYSNPQVLIDEMGNADVLITPHFYSKENDSTANVGKYCVQFLTFKNNDNALTILRDWRNECLEWCYNRWEDGKCGDQKYLDKWPSTYQRVCETTHLGGGVAPWNQQRYLFYSKQKSPWIHDTYTNSDCPVIFFHFHYLFTHREWVINEFSFDTYQMRLDCVQLLYLPYLKVLRKAYLVCKKCNPEINGLFVDEEEISWPNYLRKAISRVRHHDYTHKKWICLKN